MLATLMLALRRHSSGMLIGLGSIRPNLLMEVLSVIKDFILRLS